MAKTQEKLQFTHPRSAKSWATLTDLFSNPFLQVESFIIFRYWLFNPYLFNDEIFGEEYSGAVVEIFKLYITNIQNAGALCQKDSSIFWLAVTNSFLHNSTDCQSVVSGGGNLNSRMIAVKKEKQ